MYIQKQMMVVLPSEIALKVIPSASFHLNSSMRYFCDLMRCDIRLFNVTG